MPVHPGDPTPDGGGSPRVFFPRSTKQSHGPLPHLPLLRLALPLSPRVLLPRGMILAMTVALFASLALLPVVFSLCVLCQCVFCTVCPTVCGGFESVPLIPLTPQIPEGPQDASGRTQRQRRLGELSAGWVCEDARACLWNRCLGREGGD